MVVWCFPAASLIRLSIHVQPGSGQGVNRCQNGVYGIHGALRAPGGPPEQHKHHGSHVAHSQWMEEQASGLTCWHLNLCWIEIFAALGFFFFFFLEARSADSDPEARASAHSRQVALAGCALISNLIKGESVCRWWRLLARRCTVLLHRYICEETRHSR